MATADAVAAVGQTLQVLLADRIDNPSNNGTPLPVTLGYPGPDRDPDGGVDEARINLFLYEVVEDCFLKNQEIPGHGHPSAYGHPPLSLDLHYLLTVYGSTTNGNFFDETPAHLLLGAAMQVLHDNAVIGDSLVTRRQPGRLILDPALRDEYESVKVTLRPLGLEDLSNVWTGLELSWRLSVAYEISVIQIESTRPRRHPRPVGEPPLAGPRVVAVPLQRPGLSSIGVRRAGDPPGSERSVPLARIGDTLVIHGNRLGGGLVVRIDRVDLVPSTVGLASDTLEVDVPDDPLLQPGTHTVAVVSVVPEMPGAAISSGGLPLVLVPAVTSANVAGRTLTVGGSRLIDAAAPAEIIVGNTLVERAAYGAGSTADSVDVPVPATLPAFPVPARVSGSLAPFPGLPGAFDLIVRVGSAGPQTVTLTSTPTSLPEAAAAVQAAINGAIGAPGFDRVRVAATSQELVLVAGDLTSPITVSSGALANALQLAGGSSARNVYLSGALRPFPVISQDAPQVQARIGATTATVVLGAIPTSLAAAAATLEAGLQAASGVAAFTGARVSTLGDQLCVLPGAGGAVTFGPLPGVDDRTVAELGLAASYLVRARVRGVESIDEQVVDLP